ncbi:MAG: DNA mismatch repair protein MutL, partial [bacterium]|nr:DNA mismatch repair protein MutL [bacterium]
DQHALHERVMFEKLKDRIASKGSLESQRLLMPTVVGTTEGRVDLLEQTGELFERLGIDAHGAGPSSVSVQSFPTFLFEKGVEPGPFVEELLERCEAEGFAIGSEEALHEILDMMACKAAVKAGDRMTDEELGELLKLRAEIERSSNCPHGRPTAIRLSVSELERQFGRS